jgi:uncharacterized protein
VAKRIVVTGGTGFVGRRLVRALVERGDAVTVLTRDPAGAALPAEARLADTLPGEARLVPYTPLADGPWCAELKSADALVLLAGAQAVGVRWTKAQKREIESSRIDATRVIVEAISRLPAAERPATLVGASAVGYYGPRDPSDAVDESSTPGHDYLARLVARWEAEQARAADLGLRVAHVRFGMVLGRGGGALERLALPFRLHVGGTIGTGAQMVPWIHLDDACGIVMCAVDHASASGPVNAVAPNRVTMRELSEAIGAVLGRSAYLPVPSAALRLLYGEAATPILTGQNVASSAPCSLGYGYRFTDLTAALRDALGLA